MGAYLSSPVTDKECAEGENDVFQYGVAAMQGWRTDMEDAHAAVLDVDGNSRTGVFAVFDGHGGKEVAKFCAAHLPQELSTTDGFHSGEVDRALTQAYLKMDELLLKDEHREELKALKGSESEEEPQGAPMVISGSSLPESILEALGMGPGGDFQIKIVRSGDRVEIEDIEGDLVVDEDPEESAAEGAAVMEVVEGVRVVEVQEADDDEGEAAKEGQPGGIAAAEGDSEGPDARQDSTDSGSSSDRNGPGKRKREKAMEVDDAVGEEGEKEVQPSTADGGGTGVGEEAAAAAVSSEEPEAEGYSTPPQGEDEYVGPSAGCTAVCAVVRGNELWVANAGDSRCVFSRGGTAVAMTTDHKPNDQEEYARIIKAGGFVADGRVNGSLNLSRALGDMEYKQTKELGPDEQMVTAVPEVRKEVLQPGDEFILLACDGIWDVLTNQEAVDFVRERLLAGKSPRQIAEEMCDRCLAPDTSGCGKGCDNMSVVVVVLKPLAEQILSKQAQQQKNAENKAAP